MSPNNKVLAHPKKEEIIKRLIDGDTTREIAEWLRIEHPGEDQSHLRISFSSLSQFKREFLDIQGTVASEVEKVRKAKKEEVVTQEVKSTTAYQRKLNEIVDNELDVKRELVKIFMLLESRLEKVYDMLEKFDYPNTREERLLISYIETAIKVLESHKKYVEGYSETTNQNININIMNDQVSVMRDAVREALNEASPDVAIKFMGALNTRLNALNYTGTGYVLGEVAQ